jgi:hypothetical protein
MLELSFHSNDNKRVKIKKTRLLEQFTKNGRRDAFIVLQKLLFFDY